MNRKESPLVNAAEPIDGSTATPAELRRAGIDALVRALSPGVASEGATLGSNFKSRRSINS